MSAPKERPILFSGPMVRALLDGRKTQTRRVVKPRGRNSLFAIEEDGSPFWSDSYIMDRGNAEWRMRECPYGVPGDRLWVREAFSYDRLDVDHDRFMEPWFWADGNPAWGDWTRPKPSIHMPRIYSRLTLEITEVRVERLQDISSEDAVAEGLLVENWTGWGDEPGLRGPPEPDAYKGFAGQIEWTESPVEAYRLLWEHINGAGSWAANPWVWAVSFRVLEGPK